MFVVAIEDGIELSLEQLPPGMVGPCVSSSHFCRARWIASIALFAALTSELSTCLELAGGADNSRAFTRQPLLQYPSCVMRTHDVLRLGERGAVRFARGGSCEICLHTAIE